MGTFARAGTIEVFDSEGQVSIRLDGASGKVDFAGGDCAECFEVADEHAVEPGAVVVVDDSGKLRACGKQYDKRVVGVISGADGSRPAVLLGADGDLTSVRRSAPAAEPLPAQQLLPPSFVHACSRAAIRSRLCGDVSGT